MMRSILADQPYSEVVSTQGESAMRLLTSTFSTLSPNTSFINLVNGSNSAFISSIFFFSSSSSVKTLLGGGLELLAVEFLQLLHTIFVNWVNHVQNLKTLLSQALKEWRRGHCRNALTCDVVNVILAFLHAVNVLLEADALVTRFGGLISEELS